MYFFTNMLTESFLPPLFYSINIINQNSYSSIIDDPCLKKTSQINQNKCILKIQPQDTQTYVKNGFFKKQTSFPLGKTFQQQPLKKTVNSQQKTQNLERSDIFQVDQMGKIHVRIQWRNQNRNIIPNIMNQMISYLCKPFKSKKMVNRIFQKENRTVSWTPRRYYNYLKLIKQKISNYLDEEDLKLFFVIQSVDCEIYPYQEQRFYMKVCRILINYFLKNEVILIAGTSTRMNVFNRKTHLVGRDLLLKMFDQMSAEHRQK